MKNLILIAMFIVLTACSRSIIVTRDDPYYDLRIKRMNLVGSKFDCSVGFKNGRKVETIFFKIDNANFKYVEQEKSDTLIVPFSDVTSIYYIDRWDGLFHGALIGGFIGYPVGYILLPDWRDFGGALQHSPETGGCCIGGIGTIAGSVWGVSYGSLKQYTLEQDSTNSTDSLIIWRTEK